jgi:hypothetical protein
MTNPNDLLRDKLLSINPSEAPQIYEARLRELIDARLSPARLIPFAIAGFACLGFSIWFVWLAAATVSLPLLARAGLIGGSLLSLAWCGISLGIVRSGTFNRRRHNAQLLTLSGITGIGVGVLMVVLGLDHPDLHVMVRAGFAGVMSFLSGMVFLIRHVLDQMDLNQREKLLEIQWQISSLSTSK